MWRWSRRQRCWQRRREKQQRRLCRRLSAQFCTTGLGPGPHRLTTLNLGECWNRSKMSEQSFGELKLTRPSLRWSGLQRESAWHRSSCHSGSLSAPTWQRVWNVGNLRYGRFNEDILRIIWGYIEDNMRIYWGYEDCYIRLWATGGRSGWMYSKYIPLSGTNIIQTFKHSMAQIVEERFKYWMMIGNYFLS